MYETKISDARWIAYDIPGNIGWIVYIVTVIIALINKQFLPFSCLDCTGDLFQLYCGNILSVVILFADKLKTSTDKLSSYYINVKYFKKSAF